MRHFSFRLLFGILASGAILRAEITQKTVVYTDEAGAKLEGVFVYDTAQVGTKPGVVVVPDWRGMTETPIRRARMLAQLGFPSLVADVYGQGVRPNSVAEFAELSTKYKKDRPLMRQRLRAAYATLKQQPQVNSNQVAAIGYCFGGTGVIEMARDGLPLRGVVSFHGGLDSTGAEGGKAIKTKILTLCGADDPTVSPANFAAFEEELRVNGVDYQIVKYGHAVHAFTDPGVDALNRPEARYNPEADHRSWQAMRDFFAEIF